MMLELIANDRAESMPYVIITDLGDRTSDRLAVKSAAIEILVIGTLAFDRSAFSSSSWLMVMLF